MGGGCRARRSSPRRGFVLSEVLARDSLRASPLSTEPRERFELLLSVERNEVGIEEAAARLGTTVDRLQERLELVSLTREALVQRAAPVRSPFHARWLVAAAVVVAGLAFAQLTTFTADTPAMANAVNGNFTQLRTWIEQKVGTVGRPTPQTLNPHAPPRLIASQPAYIPPNSTCATTVATGVPTPQ